MTGFSDYQQRSADAAFGRFNPDQGLHIFAREYDSGHEPGVVEVALRTWWIQPGMVNVGLFETDEGLLLVDAGCRGDGPALLRAVRSVSDQPLHTVVFTHGHADHAFGLWAFREAGETPWVVAHENVPAHFERYIKTAGHNARLNGQQAGLDGKRWLEGRRSSRSTRPSTSAAPPARQWGTTRWSSRSRGAGSSASTSSWTGRASEHVLHPRGRSRRGRPRHRGH